MEIQCDFCGTNIIRPKSKISKKNYCSVVCRRKGMSYIMMGRKQSKATKEKIALALKGKNKKVRTVFICDNCGKEFKALHCQRKRNLKFCSIICANKARCGENSPNWKGGRFVSTIGYVYISRPKHNKANSSGFVLEHRIIMEKILKRYLSSNELVHHKNGKKDDNRPENLEIVLKNSHRGEVECPHCQKKFSIQ